MNDPVISPRPTDRHVLGKDEQLLDAVALLLPLTRLIEIKIVGNLFLHDILTPIVLVLLSGNRVSLAPLRPFLVLLATWFIGAFITDVYRHSAFADFSRGWSKIILFGLNAAMVWKLTRGRGRRLIIYAFSSGVALAIASLFRPGELDETDPWKFGLGYGVALALTALAMSDRGKRLFSGNVGSLALGVVALVSIVQNARSLFAICALAAAYAPVASWFGRRPSLSRRLSPLSFMGIILAGLIAGQALVGGYGALAKAGVLGRDAQDKFLVQTEGSLNVLQGGRQESLVSLEAIKDSPIIGHGSWAKDPYYLQLLLVKIREAGLPSPGNFYDIGNKTEFIIPTHSFIFGSWVESGILGVPIWIYLFFLAFRSLYAIIKVRGQASALLCLVAFAMMWDVFFSPFAADTRILKGMELCVLIAAVSELRAAGAIRAGTRSEPRRRSGVGAVGPVSSM